MSSTAIIRNWENACGSVRRFRYVLFAINSSIVISLTFIVGTVTYGTGWR